MPLPPEQTGVEVSSDNEKDEPSPLFDSDKDETADDDQRYPVDEAESAQAEGH